MLKLRFFLGLALAGVLLPVQAAVVFDYGSDWKYRIGTSEASSPDASAWRQATFTDSSWAAGPAPIGYANPPNHPAESALRTFLPTSQAGGYLSVFFRKTFNVKVPADVQQFILHINVDDGYVAWLNGVEIGRFNVPAGNLAFNASASSAIEPTLTSIEVNNPSKWLVAGVNVIAVQVFNANFTSSDLVFDAALMSDLDETPPVVVETLPRPGSTVRELTQIEVVFDENVFGVDAEDLLIEGAPARAVTQFSPRDYVFEFEQPAPGLVNVAWTSNHQITDGASSPNLFTGGSWTYTLDPSAPLGQVVISEFMADNANGIRDDDGRRSDWIELFNEGTTAVNLEGWFLTDTIENPTKWRFPAIHLDRNRYLLLWASGNDRTDPNKPLHTNFRLPASGSYLALLDPDTNIVSEFAPVYPPQRADISFGRDLVEPEIVGYFLEPTPGAPNSISGPGFAPEPLFSRASGVFTNNTVTVTLSAPSGQIRYTLDGSLPGANSTLYSGAITLTTTTVIKARVFEAELLPSRIIAESYALLDSSAARFDSNLPIMIFSTSGRSIAQNVPPGQLRTFASLVAIDTFRGRSSPLGEADYLGQCELEIRGQTSAGFPKRPYNLELQDAYRNDRNAQLLGLPSGSDWVLNNPYSDKPFLQNFLAFELHEKMGHYAVRRRFVEVFINTTGGKVAYPRDYAGVYLLLEKIKRAGNRVEISRLTPYDNTEPNISGGYMFKKDKDSGGDLNFSTSGGGGFSGQNLKIHEPKPREITPTQLAWLRNYLNQFERALYAPDWRTATGTNHYSHYIDIDSFVDNHWIVEFSKQIDGYRLSNYMQKDRGGKIRMDPIWDWNLSFGNADYLEGWRTNGWYYPLISATDHIWLRRLINGTTSGSGTSGDPDFNQRIVDRWSELRTNVLAASNVLARVDEMAGVLNEAAARDFQKWPRLGTYVWPNPSFYVAPTTYQGIINAMKTWIQGRYHWIDSQFVRAPVFNVPGGRVPAGFRMSLSSSAATIYYTLDGSDPRLPGGGLSPRARAYTGPATIMTNTKVFSRVLNNARWTGPSVAVFITETPPLVITEIMFSPAPPPPESPFDKEDFEFLEFTNRGSEPLELAGFRITNGVRFDFPAGPLEPGQRVLVVKNRAAFESRYGTELPVIGEFEGQLNNAGERIRVAGPLEETVLDFAYSPAWSPVTAGLGFSLVLADETIAHDQFGLASSWRASFAMNGSPARPEPPARTFPPVVVNEVLTRPGDGGGDFIELHNFSSTPASVGGWYLTDDFRTPRKFRIPDGTIVPASGFALFTSEDFGSNNPLIPFGLSASGEEVYLFSGEGQTNLTGYAHGFEFGAQVAGVTFGRHVDSTGIEHFVAQTASTPGASNSPPLTGPVVISEIMYRPPEVLANGAFWNNTEDEYIELFNRADHSVELFDAAFPANTWRLENEARFSFPTNVTLPPGSHLLVVNFDPDTDSLQLLAFRDKFKVPVSVPIFGPYRGNLNNRGGTVALSMPLPNAGGDADTVPYVLVERVDYASDLPWPPGADGLGYSLNRMDPDAFGNDPSQWSADNPSPGRAPQLGEKPVITVQPASQWALANQTVMLSVSATGEPPLRYQWRFNGSNLDGATNASLVLPAAQPGQSGLYSAVVMNPAGASATAAASVVVELDSDGDGIPDNWELAHGLNPFDPSDATEDADGDGFSNRDEFIAGTNPRDPASRLQIHSVTAGPPALISFAAAAYRTYTIEYSDSLAPALWTRLGDVGSRETNFMAVVSDPAGAEQRYYRLITPARP
jgi:hypothetical protein